jgi:DNA-binding NtrC family response regulator
VSRFIDELNARHGQEIEGITSGGLKLLMDQEWPGNVRHLRNVIEGAYIVCTSRWLGEWDLKYLHWSSFRPATATPKVSVYNLPLLASEGESAQVLSALESTHWNKSKAAQLLHTSRMTVYRKIAKYRIHKDRDGEMSDSSGGPVPVEAAKYETA